MTNKTFQQ